MPGHPRAGVDIGRIAPMRLADRARQSRAGARVQDEVNVVGHQALGPAREPVVCAALGEEVAVELIVAGLREQRLTAVAVPGHMMRRIGDDDAGEAGHERRLHRSIVYTMRIMSP